MLFCLASIIFLKVKTCKGAYWIISDFQFSRRSQGGSNWGLTDPRLTTQSQIESTTLRRKCKKTIYSNNFNNLEPIERTRSNRAQFRHRYTGQPPPVNATWLCMVLRWSYATYKSTTTHRSSYGSLQIRMG